VKIAKKSPYPQWKHGAIIEKGGSFIAAGVNSKSPIYWNTEVFSVHAEADACSKVYNNRSATMYVARVNKQGQVRNSKPCPDCEKLLRKQRFSRVYYSIAENEWGRLDL
jgi:deoxycytidylate deaminase